MLVFATETGGSYVDNPLGPIAGIDTARTSTLDLFLVVDPPTKRVLAQYRVNSDDASAIKTIGEFNAASFPGLAPLFKLGAAAGVLSTNGTGSAFGLAYDYFRIDPSASPAPFVPERRGIYLPIVVR